MKRRNLVGITIAIAVATAALLAWRGQEHHEAAQNPMAEAVNQPDPFPVSIPARDPTRERARRALTPLWRVVDERTTTAKPAYADEWSEEGRVLVDVSGATYEARTWRVGDRVAIALPQLGEVYESTIDRIDEGPGHSRSVRGLIVGADGQRRRVVVTVGPGRVFAYIDTEDGPYELVADARIGWLLPSSSMMAGIDFSKPDYLLPERRGGNGDVR